REAIRKRWGLYAALIATWAILWASFSQIFDARSAGFGMVHMKWWEYTLSQFGVILHYLRLSFWPRPLCLDYMWPIAETTEQILLPGAVMAILVGATCWGLWRRPAGGFLGAWFFLILTPSSSILPINDLAFEHRMYLSLAGVITAVVLGGYALGRASLKRLRPSSQGGRLWPKLTASAIVAAIAAALGAATYDRNKDYRTEEAIWTNIVRQRPNNFRAQNNYGLIQFGKGNIDTAIKAYKTALNLNPGYGLSHHNLGKTYLMLRRYDDAMQHLREAIDLSIDNAQVFNDLGFGYFRTGKIDQAIEACRKALSIDPNLDESHYTLALALSRKESFREAIVHYRQAVDLGFRGPDVYYNLALALSRTESYDEAIENYQEAIRMKPDHQKAHCNLGIALNLMGKAEQAIEHLLEAISIDPNYTTAHHNLALVLVGQGSYTDALEHFRRAAELQPDSPRAQDSLARLLSTCPHDSIRNGAEAVELAERACAAAGYKEREYLDTLAAAYAETGQFNRAVATIQRAIGLAEAGADAKTIEQLRVHLSLYGTGKPLREGK
ncbi:MAG: tetratricopeptide repeat protein, partial [Phycisphaerae bacterium]|nr:tetratricopeptide repeat protein [Phycisphaerae bacterium]